MECGIVNECKKGAQDQNLKNASEIRNQVDHLGRKGCLQGRAIIHDSPQRSFGSPLATIIRILCILIFKST